MSKLGLELVLKYKYIFNFTILTIIIFNNIFFLNIHNTTFTLPANTSRIWNFLAIDKVYQTEIYISLSEILLLMNYLLLVCISGAGFILRHTIIHNLYC